MLNLRGFYYETDLKLKRYIVSSTHNIIKHMDINTINTIGASANNISLQQMDAAVRPTIATHATSNSIILNQPISINLLNSFDLQAKLQKTILDNMITINRELAFENQLSLQNAGQIPLGTILEGISQSILAFFALDNIQQNTRSQTTERTEDISKLFYNFHTTNQPALNHINASFNALLRKIATYFQNEIRPQPYEKDKKREKKKQSANNFGVLGKIISKLLNLISIQ